MKATIEKMRAAVDPENEKSVNTFNTTTGSMVDAYNAKAAATQARFDARLKANNEKAEAWNARNAALIEREKSYTGSNDQWKDNCSNRRFREDDEKAIRAGK
jgi:hypothetical protein